MWIVAKIKSKEFSIFKKELNIKFGNEVKYYFPKILLGKKKLNTSNLLGNYVFCFHEKFNDVKNLVFSKYIKGLDYFLENCKNSQNEINNFIEICKKNENTNGCLGQNFFSEIISSKGKFVNSALASLVFEIIGKEKKYLNIIIGKREVKISKNSNIFYLPA